jgi:predicted nucleic acid-binding protein
MTVLVDSDILIEVSRGRDAEIVSRWLDLSKAGARPKEHTALDNLFNALVCGPIDVEVGYQAGIYLRQFRRSHGVEVADALIAASAVANQADLWTRNRGAYPMKDVSFFD